MTSKVDHIVTGYFLYFQEFSLFMYFRKGYTDFFINLKQKSPDSNKEFLSL